MIHKVKFTRVTGKMVCKMAGVLIRMKQVHSLVFGDKAKNRKAQ